MTFMTGEALVACLSPVLGAVDLCFWAVPTLAQSLLTKASARAFPSAWNAVQLFVWFLLCTWTLSCTAMSPHCLFIWVLSMWVLSKYLNECREPSKVLPFLHFLDISNFLPGGAEVLLENYPVPTQRLSFLLPACSPVFGSLTSPGQLISGHHIACI